MTTKAAVESTAVDKVKLTLAALLLGLGVVGFYLYSESSQLYRVLGLLAVAGVAAAIAATTLQGKALLSFMSAARTEVRKVVWPTRAETVQTTLIVFVMVILIGIFLWLLDMLLGWLIRFVIG